MGKRYVDRSGLAFDRPFDLLEFYARLHQVIGGAGPNGLAWDMELPDTNLEPDEFRVQYLWAEIASKFNPRGGKSQRDRKNSAMELFRESEEACAQTNTLLKSGAYRGQVIRKDNYMTLDSVLYTASLKIRSLLGKFSWDACDSMMDFGPGASFDVPRAKASPWFKFETNLDVNPQSIPLALAVLAGRPAWCRSLIEKGGCVVPNPKNRLTTVPKNYKRDRVIAIEPLMNVYIQKGVGGLIRKRLLKAGINLNSQVANQLGALVGSLGGELSTIDLKSASDTISYGIVSQLLPPDWLSALEQCRSELGVLDTGEIILYRKFSSMGCGFTFELETLIFWGICQAVLDLCEAKDRRLLVYGDDIVCPSENSEDILRALELCGFTPNKKKTHIDGPFRESCGKHFLGGFDVSPFYVKSDIVTAGDLFLLHNNVMRWSARGFVCNSDYRRSYDGKLQSLLSWIRDHIPSRTKPTLCDGLGDSGFIGSFDEVLPTYCKYVPEAVVYRSQGRGHSCEHYALTHWPEIAMRKDVNTGGMIPLMLSSLDRKENEDWLPPFYDRYRLRDSHEFSSWQLYVVACVLADVEDSPPIGRVVARKRARKTLRVPLREWNELGIWE